MFQSILATRVFRAALFAIVCSTAICELHAQEEVLPNHAIAVHQQRAVIDELLACESSSKLLEKFEMLIDNRQLHQLSHGGGNLPWTTLPLSGWRWEGATARNGRIILAIEGALVVAIYESHRSTIEMSLRDYSGGERFNTNFDINARIPKTGGDSVQHVSAMSVRHFSHKSPELFSIYYYFAGPTREIVNAERLPRPIWMPKWAK